MQNAGTRYAEARNGKNGDPGRERRWNTADTEESTELLAEHSEKEVDGLWLGTSGRGLTNN